MKNFAKHIDFCILLTIFALEFHTRGRDQARLIFHAGIFIACISICGPVPPCGVLMHPLPLWWNSTGKTGPFLFPPVPNIIFCKMNSTEKCSGENNSISLEQIHPDLIQSDEIQAMRSHLREMIDSFLLSEDTSDLRRDVYSTFLSLDAYLNRVNEFNLRRN